MYTHNTSWWNWNKLSASVERAEHRVAEFEAFPELDYFNGFPKKKEEEYNQIFEAEYCKWL